MKTMSIKSSNMKKISQRNVVNYKSIIGMSTMLASALMITGCQSTNLNQSSTIAANNTPTAAKTALAKALQQQRRQSFSYHSNLEINNDDQFTNVDTKQLVAADDADRHCEDTHDQAYAALLAQAETQNKDIAAIDYNVQRNALKQSYLACADAYQAWEDNQYLRDSHYSDDDSEHSEYASEVTMFEVSNYDDLSSSETAATDTLIIEESNNINRLSKVTKNTASPYYEALFTEYDSKQTKLDVKKSQLLDAYLLKPLSMNAQGVYQPLAGKFTMLGSVQYSARNNHTSINQPIYIDFKTGNIYLWADNFALLTSEFADNKLGTKWQNKWLRIAVDDGTLPKGFGRAVIKNHFEALDRTYDKAPITQFDFIAPNTLAALSPKLPDQQLAPMLQSEQIIRRIQTSDGYEQSYKDYMRTFYDLVSVQYPELVKDSETMQHNSSRPNSDKFTSKSLVQQALVMMKTIVDNNDEAAESMPIDGVERGSTVQELYGFNQRGQLQWQHLRTQLPSKTSRKNKSNKDMTADVLQQYLAIRAQDVSFPNLPSDMQVPNASNSIDLREYSSELIEYYRDGNGTAMGKLFFGRLPFNKGQYEDMTE